MEFLRNLFGTENKLSTGGKSATEFLEYNGELINQVVRDIVEPFLNPNTAANNKNIEYETDLSYTLKLMDSDTCGQMAFYLSKNMSEMIKTYDISGFGGPINTIAPGTKSITEANIQTPTGMVSRKQICDRLAGHYVTIINLIGAILTGINPQTNMALSRMNNLYTLVDGTTDTFIINICTKEGKQNVKSSLLDEPGVKEFMGLYLFHLLSVSESPADKDRVMREYQQLVRKLVDEDRTVAMPMEIPQSVNMETQPTNSPQSVEQTIIQPIIQPITTKQTQMQLTDEMPITQTTAHTGIFGNISEKLSSGFSQLLSSNTDTKPHQYGKYPESQSSESSTNSSSSASSNNSIKMQQQNELDKLNAELKHENDTTKQIALKKRIQELIFDLRSSNSISESTSSSSSSQSNRRHHKKHRHYSSSSRSSDSYTNNSRSRRQYGGNGSLSANASVARFITFMEKYIQENPNDKRTIMRNVLTMFKGGHFKQPDINRIKTLCKNADTEGKEITLKIQATNTHLKKYNDNWLEMRNKYMKSVADLVNILENRILVINNKTLKLEVRNISSRELADLETKTRNILGELYSNAHQHYVLGVNALYDYYHDLTSGVPAY